MQSIKNSYVDCSKCQLYECKSIVADTNCKHDLSAVDIIYVCESPRTSEIDLNTPIASEMFSTCFDGDINYFITNVVLCQSLDANGEHVKPPQEVIDYCKSNLHKMIELCNPKLIVAIGKTACEALEFKGSITNNAGKLTQYRDWDVLINMHPDYVMKQGGIDSKTGKKFISIMKKAVDIINNTQITSDEIQGDKYMYKIDQKFYTEDYRLVDIQFIAYQQKLVFIFRDKENKKVFYEPVQKDLNYYWYESLADGELIEKFENLQLQTGNYKSRSLNKHAYESDIKPDRKHACDYYLQSYGEAPIVAQNTFFFDIEVYTYEHKGFPDVNKGEWPINAISFSFDGQPTEVYLLSIKGHIDPKIDEIKDKYDRLTIFTDERQMLTTFIKKLHSYEPDFIAGWNVVGFDMQYLYSRLKTLGINPKCLSPFGNVYIDGARSICDVTGYIVLDQLWLYKNLTYTNEPSYKLENICQKVLGKGKRPYEGSLNWIYENNIGNFVEYSFIDSDLLPELEDSLCHISLQNEIRQASTTSHSAAASTLGLTDGLFNFEMKFSGYAMTNSRHSVKGEFEGAYVRKAVGGIYDWVIDFDYTSLYPSIICSYNIGPNTYVAKVSEQVAHDYIYNRKFLEDKTFDIVIAPLKSDKIQKCDFKSLEKLMDMYNCIMAPSGCIYKGHNYEKSIFYSIIKKLFKQRKTYKHMMFDYKQAGDDMNRKIFNNKQMSYKILLNSLYGVMAQEHFRFYSIDLASTVTHCGRDLIKFAGEHCDTWMKNGSTEINPNYMTDVENTKDFLRYCDTDSLFLWMEPYLKNKNLECNTENILSEASTIQNWLNSDLLANYAKMHNIPLDESMFELKNELVCKRYYSLNVKKKYALHVINNEGVDTDEIDIKGLEIKRSDFSALTKELLNHIIDTILKSPNVNTTEILDYVEEMTNRARKMAVAGDPELFKTVSFSKPLEEYKTVPQHLKGMLMWNVLEHHHFHWGTRGVLVPLKAFDLDSAPKHIQENYHNKFLKEFKREDLNVIVIPEELPKLPEYYTPDVKKILDFAVKERADLLLEPLVKRNDDILLWN